MVWASALFRLGESIYRKFDAASSPVGWHQRRNLVRCARLVPPGELLLDVGSGRLPYKGLFRSHQYISLDVDRQGKIDLQASIDALPLRDSKVDLVLCLEVLEHVERPQQALSEIRRVLKPDGYLILSIPFLYGEHGQYGEVEYGYPDYYRWTRQGLKKMLAEQNFDDLHILVRGGIFTVIADTLVSTVMQMFMPSPAHQRTWWGFPQYFMQVLSRLVLMPVIVPLMMIDLIDRKKNFTTGYTVLARKATSQ